MFKDVELSKQLLGEFVTSLQTQQMQTQEEPQLEGICILTDCTWPIKKSDIPTCLLPAPLKSLVFRFERFYNSRHQKRKLHWLP